LSKKRKNNPTEVDHIWPTAEDGPDVDWNKRTVSRAENRSKGARMPNVEEVQGSTMPIKLAVEIDRHTLEKPFRHQSNKNRGFGGLPRL
jgi:CRISPR/Cas system Type II protein with McrA/HNH and RuvC-like nuclease domain